MNDYPKHISANIERHAIYELTFEGVSKNQVLSIKGDDLWDELAGRIKIKFELERIKPSLKQIHIALSRAIEEGDQLKIGIVLGQTVSKLEELINQ
jgi:hypothetical protein